MERIRSLFTLRNYAVFLLVLFCIHYIPIETRTGVGWLKVMAMGTCPIVLLWKTPNISKAGIIIMTYFFCALTVALFHYQTFRASTVLFLLSFLILYWTFYNLITIEHVFSLGYFVKTIKRLILVYTIVLIIQQLFLLAGIKLFPPINLCQILNRGIGANSLTYEPSTAARMMGVFFYAYLKCNEYLKGEPINFPALFRGEHKWVTIGFLWSMTTMGSGTAFICLIVLSFYFIRREYLVYIVPLFFIIYFTLPYSQNESLQRAVKFVEVSQTFDIETIRHTDSSAASRINPLINTLTKLDFSDAETWLGHGVDYERRMGGHLSKYATIGGIGDYGLIVYFIGLILVFSCSIHFFSIPTIMYFVGIGGGTGNIAYAWAQLMVFTCIRYFYDNKGKL